VGVDPGAALRKAAALLLALPFAACAHTGVDVTSLSSSSDQVVWEAGQKALGKKNYDSARQHFKRIVDGFPQSQYGPGARLGLADSHFKEGGSANYILAVAQYRDFLTLYPSHPKSDYAPYQVGESYFNQKNTPDRDQGPTEKSLAEYQRLLDIYPQSPFVEPARGRIRQCRQSLARAEFSAGFFYQKTRQAWRAATLRFEGIINDYPDYERIDEVLFRLSECLAASGRKAEALPHLARLLAEYPTSPFANGARRLTDALALKAGPDAPLPVPLAPPAPAPPPSSAPATSPRSTP
jgi:outer membrane protein assembly factor BamD